MNTRASARYAACTSTATSRPASTARNCCSTKCTIRRTTGATRFRPAWSCARRSAWPRDRRVPTDAAPGSGRFAREKALHALEEALAARRVLVAVLSQRFVELAQQLTLLCAELHRR